MRFMPDAKPLPLCLKDATEISIPFLNLSFLLAVNVLFCPLLLFLFFLSFFPSLSSCTFTIETSVFTSCVPFKESLFILQSAGV